MARLFHQSWFGGYTNLCTPWHHTIPPIRTQLYFPELVTTN